MMYTVFDTVITNCFLLSVALRNESETVIACICFKGKTWIILIILEDAGIGHPHVDHGPHFGCTDLLYPTLTSREDVA